VAPVPWVECVDGASLKGRMVPITAEQEDRFRVGFRDDHRSRLTLRCAMHRAENTSNGLHHVLECSDAKRALQRHWRHKREGRWRRCRAGALHVFNDGLCTDGRAGRSLRRSLLAVPGRIIAEPRDVSKRLHRPRKCLLPVVVGVEAVLLKQTEISLCHAQRRTKIVNEQVQDTLRFNVLVLWHVR